MSGRRWASSRPANFLARGVSAATGACPRESYVDRTVPTLHAGCLLSGGFLCYAKIGASLSLLLRRCLGTFRVCGVLLVVMAIHHRGLGRTGTARRSTSLHLPAVWGMGVNRGGRKGPHQHLYPQGHVPAPRPDSPNNEEKKDNKSNTGRAGYAMARPSLPRLFCFCFHIAQCPSGSDKNTTISANVAQS